MLMELISVKWTCSFFSQFMTIFHRKKLNEDDLKISVIFQKMCEDLTQVNSFNVSCFMGLAISL